MPDNDTEVDESSVSGTPAGHGGGGLGLGERLRSARKAKAISLESVAEALHLDESVILDLEDERFGDLGAPVFVRGHLKAYAKLVGLAPDIVADAYRATDPPAPAVPPIDRRVRRSVTINPIVWGFSALVLLLGLVLAMYVLQDDAGEPVRIAAPVEETPPAVAVPPVPAPAELPATEADAAEADRYITNPAPEPGPAVPDEPLVSAAPAGVAAPAVAPDEAVAAAAPVTPVTRPQADVVRLSLHFREESWVEISDANRRLLFGLQREGRRRELSGEPPFQLLLGNAAGVDLSVNDEPYAVPVSRVNGKVARFEIDAAGIE